ncbi:MAG: prepilin-type N-terminal cleavage/methylation domain-containing protein [Deltaproteobacteria bacterium]|nr:prepilin-type N-terminal cleavage/methylation domain-containing protein [Deltaproteobacteria bacterium]
MNNRGFTMIEMVLYMVVAAIITGVTVHVMRTHVNAYSFITNRHTALSDVSYALNRMSYELLRVETAEITAIAADSIDFTDDDGNAASFETAANADGTGLYRGDELLISPVTSFDLVYYDLNGIETNVIADVRSIKMTVVTAPQDTEGSITLSTMVTPRAFVYENYQ